MEEIKKNDKYDGINISELEAKIKKLYTLSRENQKEMYECLEYLRTTYRFKENPRYKKSSFWEYLEDNFTIRQGTYRENVRAFTKFPKYALEYGIGLVSKIDRVCGGMRVEKVISEIQQEGIAHKMPLSRAKMEAIIQKHWPIPKIKKEITDWKSMYENEKLAHDHTKEALQVAVKKVKELNEQIEKLKITAQVAITIRKMFDKPNSTIQRSALL
jgi:hypothetical protein